MSLYYLLSQPQPLLSCGQVTIFLTGTPEVDILMTELFLKELGELAQTHLVRQQTVKILGPAGCSPSCLEIFLNIDITQIFLAVERESVKTLRVSDADFNIILIIIEIIKSHIGLIVLNCLK